jgi:uncharacterized protein YkwD
MRKKIIACLCVAVILASMCNLGVLAQESRELIRPDMDKVTGVGNIPDTQIKSTSDSESFLDFSDIANNPGSYFVASYHTVLNVTLNFEKLNNILKNINDYPIRETDYNKFYIRNVKLIKVDNDSLYFSSELRIKLYTKFIGGLIKYYDATGACYFKLDYDIDSSDNSIKFKKTDPSDIYSLDSALNIESDLIKESMAAKINQSKAVNEKIDISLVKPKDNFYYSSNKCYIKMTFTIDDPATVGSILTEIRANGIKAVDLASYANEVFFLTNKEREKAGLKIFVLTTPLLATAETRADEIVISFSHTRPNGTSCSTAYDENGVKYTLIGENIAMGYKTPEEAVAGWMNSSGHRANILNAKFTRIGIGVEIDENGQLYWVQNFAD